MCSCEIDNTYHKHNVYIGTCYFAIREELESTFSICKLIIQS